MIKITHKQANILSIKLSSTSKVRALRFVRGRLSLFNKNTAKKAKFVIVTPNPEIVIKAQKDRELIRIINAANLSLPDGIGLAAAYKFVSFRAPKWKILRAPVLLVQGFMVGLAVLFGDRWLTKDLNIIKGRELFLELMKLANKKGWRVFLLGGEDGEAGIAVKNLQKSLKKVVLESAQGPMLDENAIPVSRKDVKIEQDVVRSINKLKPHLLFVAFGAPKQEKWVDKWMENLSIGGAMVVGGTFNYMAKKTALPPKQMEKLGLEWLWRLITQPGRAKRIFTAFPLFPLKVYWHRLTH
ncbi:WecB/TagA/CpsF family glycosyltransferase [Patescibacteria group bacterium]|nr:WecB/TagA/CpsF family glycosyltransferase [Patescibacteria group bacterium]MBU0777233.1 WecB/TagA/CpsF family glycosyltransferase [Patescibacteria group bacterium]MBU0845928.1 WecB/TagA/CpsF family glycosyltransferase [Patescibacteria group bacterium]MBU0922956.1 WecB/TagA/CpsF family glycosyltransferase [Patescibacteria group bacterium]MBU1066194.1 WecB/TagA/CpsF family glycosyltransferase [Patescibacteria group bacterium]